jgi:hypothetical protein
MRLMQYAVQLHNGLCVALEPDMEMPKARVVDESHPVSLSLLHVDDRPGNILRAFSGVGGTRTATASAIDRGDGRLQVPGHLHCPAGKDEHQKSARFEEEDPGGRCGYVRIRTLREGPRRLMVPIAKLDDRSLVIDIIVVDFPVGIICEIHQASVSRTRDGTNSSKSC